MSTLKTLARATLTSMVLAGVLFGAPSKEKLQDMKKIVGYYPEWGFIVHTVITILPIWH